MWRQTCLRHCRTRTLKGHHKDTVSFVRACVLSMFFNVPEPCLFVSNYRHVLFNVCGMFLGCALYVCGMFLGCALYVCGMFLWCAFLCLWHVPGMYFFMSVACSKGHLESCLQYVSEVSALVYTTGLGTYKNNVMILFYIIFKKSQILGYKHNKNISPTGKESKRPNDFWDCNIMKSLT